VSTEFKKAELGKNIKSAYRTGEFQSK